MDEWRFAGTRFVVVRDDITTQAVDAIVNAANSSLLGGGGVDGAIHRRGGPAILEACRELRRTRYPDGMPPGDAALTTAGALPAGYVIHTVGPVWRGGAAGEPSVLATAYRNVLACAAEHALRTIAFPSISTGAYGFPIGQAARVAVSTARDVVEANAGAFVEIRFVVFSDADLREYRAAVSAFDWSGARNTGE